MCLWSGVATGPLRRASVASRALPGVIVTFLTLDQVHAWRREQELRQSRVLDPMASRERTAMPERSERQTVTIGRLSFGVAQWGSIERNRQPATTPGTYTEETSCERY